MIIYLSYVIYEEKKTKFSILILNYRTLLTSKSPATHSLNTLGINYGSYIIYMFNNYRHARSDDDDDDDDDGGDC